MTDRELWACAMDILARHQEYASRYVAERAAECIEKGEAEGVDMWADIAVRMDMLQIAGDAVH